MVGNGATDFHKDIWPTYNDVVWGKQIITNDLHQKIIDNKCVQYFHDVFPGTVDTGVCKEYWGYLMGNTTGAGLNWYDLYRKTYTGGLGAEAPLPQEGEISPQHHTTTRPLRGEEERMTYAMVNGEKKEYKIGYTMNEYTPWLKDFAGPGGDNTLDNYVSHYINLEEVREAMHIPQSAPGWTECNAEISNTYDCGVKGSIWIYPILRHQMKILFYCGDTDGAVPCWGTRQWMQELDWDVSQATSDYFSEG
jgi:hypothetical protein